MAIVFGRLGNIPISFYCFPWSGWLQDLLAELTIQLCCWTPWKALSKSKSKSKSEMFKPLKILWSTSLFSYLVSLFGGKAVPQFHPLLTLAPALKENRDSCDRKVIKTAIFWNVMRQLIVVPHPGHGLSKRPPLNVHNCTIILCSLDVKNMMINTEFLVKEKDHLAGELTSSAPPSALGLIIIIITIFISIFIIFCPPSVLGQPAVPDLGQFCELPLQSPRRARQSRWWSWWWLCWWWSSINYWTDRLKS